MGRSRGESHFEAVCILILLGYSKHNWKVNSKSEAFVMAYALFIFVGLLVVIFVLGVIYFSIPFVQIYINAQASGVSLSPMQYIGMRLRKTPIKYIVARIIMLRKAGIHVSFDQLEAHYLANGDIYAVSEAAKEAFKADLNVSFEKICAIDLAGRDVMQAVNACIEPVVLKIPKHENYITGVCKDGIRLGARVQVTAKADIDKLIGGANEETVEARVGEGIVSSMGNSPDHKSILENPDKIVQKILNKGLDNRTAFHIISVDVSEVVVVDNIGARLQEEQAMADQLVAQANAEERRALAEAITQENHAKIVEMTVLETQNTASIPTDMALAYRRGNIWRSPRPVHSVISRNLWDPIN